MTDARRARALAAMADAGIDALVLGREANARYVSGARRLWLAGARPFTPGCVLVASTGDVHLLSASDEGVPPTVPFENLYALTWNPANLLARLSAIPGMREARRIGVDALTPGMDGRLRDAFPSAELVDGQTPMLAARARKLPEEVDAVRRATALASEALEAVIEAAVPGTPERDLFGLFEQRMCELGTTTPAFEGTFARRFPSERELGAGERVVLDVGVLVDGYEGGLARTIVCGGPTPSSTPADDLFEVVAGALRPGVTAADLWAVWDASGVPRPDEPVVHGVGLGYEPPVVDRHDESTIFTAESTVSLRTEVDGWVRRDVVALG